LQGCNPERGSVWTQDRKKMEKQMEKVKMKIKSEINSQEVRYEIWGYLVGSK